MKTKVLGNAAALGVTSGNPIVATATDANGNTSQFSGVANNYHTFLVTTTNDSGPGSLRQALTDANATANDPSGPDRVTFDIPGTGVQIITPSTDLPGITDAVVIDGYTQPGAAANTLTAGDNARLLIELDAVNIINPGLWDFTSGCTFRGLVINNADGNGIQLNGNNNLVVGDFIGTDASGTVAEGNTEEGVSVQGMNNVIGGTSPADRNVISGNGQVGIGIPGSGATGNLVLGNLVGTDATGTLALGNAWGGVSIFNGATNNTVGGTATGSRNVVSGNPGGGVSFAAPGTDSNAVLGNYIGVDVTGERALGNGNVGVFIGQGATNTLIGGTTAAARNIISANSGIGVRIVDAGTSNNLVEGNYIGTDQSGTVALGNQGDGVALGGSNTNNNQIGGLTPGAGNLISGNLGDGISIEGAGTTNTLVAGNFIGTDTSGTSPLGNFGIGVLIIDSSNNVIGQPGAGNTIANNQQTGVNILGSTAIDNSIRGNSIYGNGALGIDLNNDGVTPNHASSTAGPNDFQNYPVLSGALAGSTTLVSGTLSSLPNTTFSLDFYASASADPSGHGQGQRYLGSLSVTTDFTGNATFVAQNLGQTAVGEVISATATDPNGNTSEFAANVFASTFTANAGGPYAISEGAALSLAGSASDPLGIPLTYSWTINGHTGAATGTNPTLTWSQLQALGIDDGPATFRLALSVSDGYGDAVTTTQTITLTNTPPTASFGGPSIGVLYQPLAFTLGATDPSWADQAAGFTYAINWGDSSSTSLAGPTGITATHDYTTAGNYTVTLTATDKDGGVSQAVTEAVAVSATPLIQNGVLAIPGTPTAATYTLTPTLPSGASTYSMKVTRTIGTTTTTLGTFAVSTIEVYGGPGTDAVTLSGTASSDAFTAGSGTVSELAAQSTAQATNFTVGLNAVTSTTLSGAGGSDSLSGPNQANTWAITGSNAGTLDGTTAFTGIQNLIGGSGADTFAFATGGALSGTIDGGGGSNTLDFSARSTAVTVTLVASGANKSTATGGWTNIATVIGSAASTDALVGANTTNVWDLTAANAGTLNGTLAFSSFENLTGGTTNDSFAFLPGGSITGNLSGGAPINTLDYTDYGSAATVNLQAKSATAIGGTWANVQNFLGTGTTDALIGANATNAWSITGSNMGTVGGYSFTGFPNLTGGTGNDTFKFVSPGSLSGTINGGGSPGNDTITGDNNGDTFTLSGGNAGSIASILNNGFSNIQNLTGGNGNDRFAFLPGGSLAGSLNGGSGTNTLDDSSYGSPVTVNLQAKSATAISGAWANVQTFIGTATTDILVGASANSNWSITGTNAGTVGAYSFARFPDLMGGTGNDAFTFVSPGALTGTINGGGGNDTITGDNNGDTFTISGGNSGFISSLLTNGFSNIENLTGGTSSDTFAFHSSGSIAGNLSGGAPVNTLDYSGYGSAVTVNLQTKTATGIGGTWANVQSFLGTGTTDTLVGANATNTWLITGRNAGTVGSYSFSAFPNLTGGTGNDTFSFAAGSSVTGIVDGQAGTNTLDYSAYGSPITVNLQSTTATSIGCTWANIQSFKGTNTTDTLVATDGTTNIWALKGSNAGTVQSVASGGTVNNVAFTGFANLTGGNGTDDFQFANGATVSGVINGQGGSNTLDYSAYTSGVTVNLGNATTGLANSSATGVNGGAANGIANISNVVVGAGNNYLTAVGASMSVTFTATGSGSNILVGGSGNNALTASGSGDNILIGDQGTSTLSGGTGYNLLIGGSTAYDAVYADLQSIMSIWKTVTSATKYAQAISKLTASSYAYSLSAATVHGDANDTINAGTHALDWYFVSLASEITGENGGETVTVC